jgi:CheY-like chemotaxis protein
VRKNATMSTSSGTLTEGRTIERPNGGTMSKKLLLADDSVVIQKLVGLSFANEDVEIFSTDNGDDAVIKAREVVPDVVLADVVMPGKSGYEVCEAIKQDPALAHIPVLLLTGTFEAFDEARAESSGANGQITKPFEAQALVTRVTEVMNAPVAAVAPPVAEPIAPAIAPPLAPPIASPSEAGSGMPEPMADESDFFDPNVTSLAGSSEASTFEAGGTAGDPLVGSAGFPATEDDFLLDEPGESRSALFGQPSDVMAEEFEPVDAPSLETDFTPAMDVTPRTLDSSPEPTEVSASLEGDPSVEDVRTFQDPLEGMTDDFGLHGEGLPTPPVASAFDVDTALAAASESGDATILVAENDSNAQTSPAAMALGQVSVESRTSGFDPDTRIEVNPPMEVPPPLPPSHAPDSQPSVVADLDERLAQPVAPESESRSPEPSSQPDANFLNLGPTNLAGDDLDFAFDVSEHLPVTESEDAVEQSYSSLSDPSDISDSQIVGDPSAEFAPPTADYDVSSSDIATAATPPALPASHRGSDSPGDEMASGASNASHTPETSGASDSNLIDIDEEESAGEDAMADDVSALPVEDSFPPARAEDVHSLTPMEDSYSVGHDDDPSSVPAVEDSFSAPAVEDSFSVPAVEDSFSASSVEDSFSAPSAGDSYSAPPIELSDSEESSGMMNDSMPSEDSPDVTDELLVGGVVVSADSGSSSIPDLSPMMEQRIQETLEKVAWEAFSDLSESIVKQVMGRVEQIAWEVIPQMAETLVREEIRRMKGEDD